MFLFVLDTSPFCVDSHTAGCEGRTFIGRVAAAAVIYVASAELRHSGSMVHAAAYNQQYCPPIRSIPLPSSIWTHCNMNVEEYIILF